LLGSARPGAVFFSPFLFHFSIGHPTGLQVSQSQTLLPLYTLATMRSQGFRPGMKPDERTNAFLQFKTLPLAHVSGVVDRVDRTGDLPNKT
jgi:hypothetical protein